MSNSKWVTLVTTQVSWFIRHGEDWEPGTSEEWQVADFCKLGNSKCKIVLGSDEDVPFEINLGVDCILTMASEDFIQMDNDENVHYGLYFIDGEDASTFYKIASGCLADIKGKSGVKTAYVNASPPAQTTMSNPSRPTSSPRKSVRAAQPVAAPAETKLSPFSFFSSKPAEAFVVKEISAPYDVQHESSVHFDAEHARFTGLPEGAQWKSVNKSFGLSYEDSTKIAVDGYESKIPCVLELLKRNFIELQGQNTIGIFRLSANKDDVDRTKIELDTGKFQGCTEVNIIANLIKIFFRDMPKSLLNCVPEKVIHRVADSKLSDGGSEGAGDAITSMDGIMRELNNLQEPYKSLLFWLLDMMAIVTMNEENNKMTCKNIAIVVAPNLYSVNTENAMYALTMSQKVADFLAKCLAARLLTKFNYTAYI